MLDLNAMSHEDVMTAAAASTGGVDPLGGLLAMSVKGQLRCPDAIVRMRATVARMKPVRELRPQVSHLHFHLFLYIKTVRGIIKVV